MVLQMKRWLGIDFGLTRIGVAISDPMAILASGLETVYWNGIDLTKPVQRITQLIKENNVAGIILGHPVRTDGRRADLTDLLAEFAQAVQAETDVSIKLHDERFTTVIARRKLQEAGIKEKKQRPLIDQLAAEIILQEFLDSYRKQ